MKQRSTRGLFVKLFPEYRSISRRDPTRFEVDYHEWVRERDGLI